MRIAIALILLVSSANAYWVSPASHNINSEDNWDNCVNVYDNNIETYTNESGWPTYHYSLELLFSPAIEADKLRIMAVNYYWSELSNPSLEVLLYHNESCVLHFWGNDIPKNEWVDYPVDNQIISSAKIFSQTTEYTLRVYEFQVHEVPEPSSLILLGALAVFFVRKTKGIPFNLPPQTRPS